MSDLDDKVAAGFERLPGYEPAGPALPGRGPVLAVFVLNGHVYAVRNSDGSIPVMYEASLLGWTKVEAVR